MKKSLTLLLLPLFISVCSAAEPTVTKTESMENLPTSTPAQQPGADRQTSEAKDRIEKKRPTAKDQPAQPERSLTPAEQDEQTYSRPYRPPVVVPMQTDSIRGASDTYRDLNTRRSTPEYLQSKPRERDPFYDTVERTGGNPMNTRDRTTNRRVPR